MVRQSPNCPFNQPPNRWLHVFPGVVVDPEALFEELAPLPDAGVDTTGRLLISDRAHLLLDYHKVQLHRCSTTLPTLTHALLFHSQIVDGLLEEQRGGAAVGTTRKGIGPCYSSKATRNGLRVGHLKHFESFKKRLRDTIEVCVGCSVCRRPLLVFDTYLFPQ